MLGLKLPTDPRWVNLAEMQLEDILIDHAYCEQKAASTGISLIQAYPDRTELVEQIVPIVTEEWSHFRLVLAELKKRKLINSNILIDSFVFFKFILFFIIIKIKFTFSISASVKSR